jgi:hypothetical protein
VIPRGRSRANAPLAGRRKGEVSLAARGLKGLVGGPPPRQPLHLRITLEHGRQRDVQDPAYFEQARCADAVDAFFIFLNLLKRDTQFCADLVLAHIERQSALAHSSADIHVDGGCASWCDLFGLCFSHRFDLPHKLSGALYQSAAITYFIGSKMTVKKRRVLDTDRNEGRRPAWERDRFVERPFSAAPGLPSWAISNLPCYRF